LDPHGFVVVTSPHLLFWPCIHAKQRGSVQSGPTLRQSIREIRLSRSEGFRLCGLAALGAGLGSLLVVSDAAIRRERVRNLDKIKEAESPSRNSRWQENALGSVEDTGKSTKASGDTTELLVPVDDVLDLVREILRRNRRAQAFTH
jgi:hypothetical protein